MKALLSLLLFALPAGAAEKGRDRFVDLAQLIPGVVVEARYFGENNFMGRRVRGYEANKCLLTQEAASSLVKVQKDLEALGLRLRIFDCYRPQRAVDHFVTWAKDLADQKMKPQFYPKVDKSRLFAEGYIAEKSGHSRGSTIDLTIDGLDMGTTYDFFDPLAHTESPKVSSPQHRANRLLLKTLMEKHGFQNYEKEWWHFTLASEPFPDTYFDFPVK